jgi:DNA polymerase-3 subunit epsilon
VDFVVIDVETANPDLASVCQVGIASFRDGSLCDSWASLVNPQDYFSDINVSIHGIEEHHIRAAPTWSQVHGRIRLLLEHQIVASHTLFDRAALLRASEKSGIEPFECRWLDTARVVRRAWPAFSHAGYGLSNIAEFLRIPFDHHDALQDARAAGETLLRAISETGLDVESWLVRVAQPIDLASVLPIVREGNPDGSLFGEVLVFTGTPNMPRREASDVASAAGCEVDSGVTKHTTMLVVGDQDIRMLAGHEKSTKHRKAESLIGKGQRIRILGESDWQRLLLLPLQ